MTGGLVEMYVKKMKGWRREALITQVKTEDEYLGFLKNTFSTLKLFWELEPQQ